MLKPGTYRLTKDIPNPEGDRRHKYDWRQFPILKEGTEFIAEDERRLMDEEMSSKIQEWISLRPVKARWSHMTITCGFQLYKLLEDALERISESNASMFARLDVSSSQYFAKWLVDSGRLDRELFEKLWREYLKSEEISEISEIVLVEHTRNGGFHV